MHARKNIIKMGSFDKYILNSKPEVLDSKFGQYMRDLMIKKQKDPHMQIPYIKGSANVRNNRRTKYWSRGLAPTVFIPFN